MHGMFIVTWNGCQPSTARKSKLKFIAVNLSYFHVSGFLILPRGTILNNEIVRRIISLKDPASTPKSYLLPFQLLVQLWEEIWHPNLENNACSNREIYPFHAYFTFNIPEMKNPFPHVPRKTMWPSFAALSS